MKSNANLIIAALLIATGSVVPQSARAADAAKVDRLMQMLKIDQQMGRMTEMMESSMELGVIDAAKKKGLTQAQIERGQRSSRLR